MKTNFMKTVALSLMLSVVLFSCGGSEEEKEVTKESLVEDFCECAEKEEADQKECMDKWVEEMNSFDGSYDDGKEIGEKIVKCNMMKALEVIERIK